MTDSSDTSSNATPTADRFATGFKRLTGEVFVYGALFLAILFWGYGSFFGITGYFYASIPCLISAYYFTPYLDSKNVQLGADSQGVYVGGLGHIDWNAIADVQLVRTPVRRVERAEVRVTLNKPLEDSLLQKDVLPWWQGFMVRNWSLKQNKIVVVRLEQLKATPVDIQTDFMPFWQER